MTTPFYIVDTFTSERFKGNPTPVCLLDADLPYQTMDAIAAELNQPVTVFIEGFERKQPYRLRYFTSTGEIPACGHATLAAAKIISVLKSVDRISFQTMEDIVIETSLNGDAIFLTYPKYDPVPFKIESTLLQALGLHTYNSVFFCTELESLFIEVKEPEALLSLKPDYKAMVAANSKLKEVVVTSASHKKDYDFLLRSFCPWIGIDEDPVTGSVHSVLAHFWAGRLNKNELTAYQASARGGIVYVKAMENKVALGGSAIIIVRGSLEIE